MFKKKAVHEGTVSAVGVIEVAVLNKQAVLFLLQKELLSK